MIPRLKPTIGLPELKAALRISKRRNDILTFEQGFAEMVEQRFAVAFPYGRTGIIFLLEALGLKDKEVICPAYTCVVVPHAIVYSCNTPVFVDCKPGEFNMDLDLAEQSITEKTGAIIATSIFGYPVDLERLDAIKKKYPNIAIIQDCAHGYTASWNGKQVQKEGIAAIWGLNISKILCSIFGGMITTDDALLWEKIVRMRETKLKRPTKFKSFKRLLYLASVYPTFWEPLYQIINKMERYGVLESFTKYYDETEIDMPSDYLTGITQLEARVGAVNLDRYTAILRNRREAAGYYFNALDRNDAQFMLPPKVNGATYSHFVVRVADREKWLEKGIRSGVQLGWLIEYNIPEMKAYGNQNPDKFPVAAEYARTTINLPVWGGALLAKRVLDRLGINKKEH